MDANPAVVSRLDAIVALLALDSAVLVGAAGANLDSSGPVGLVFLLLTGSLVLLSAFTGVRAVANV